jgi:hypothetical protein
MKKLYRSALFAGVLAFGVAACGDDVQIVDPDPLPPPPLQVSLTPSNQTIVVGETADFAVGVSGGEQGAQASWTCSSSNTGVASVNTTESGCRVTGAAAGNASITVTVTKGTLSSNAGAQVTVNPAAPDAVAATVTIGSITRGGLTQPVDIDNVFGQIDVTLNVNPNDQTVTRVEVLVDGEVAAAQDIASGAFEWITPDAEEGLAEQVQQIVLSFNTARYDVDGLTATPRYLNGEHQIQARVFVAEAEEAAASNEITLNFNNEDGFHVLANFGEDTNNAFDVDGRSWWGGPDTELFVTPIPVMYSGRTVTNMSVNVRRLQGMAPVATQRCQATPTTQEIEELEDLVFEFGCAGAESNLMVPFVTSVADGNDGPSITGTDLDDYEGVLNLSASADHPFPVRIDVRAPQVVDTTTYTYRMIRQPGLNNTGNWLNDEYNFHGGTTAATRTYNAANVVDAGVGKAGALFAVSTDNAGANIVAGPAGTLTGADFAAAVTAAGGNPETVTNTEYRAWAVQPDLLENTAFFRQEAADYHPARTFGYDETDPIAMWEDDDAVVGIFADEESIVENFTAADGIFIRATDNAAGFNEEFGAAHSVVWVRGQFNGEGAIERAAAISATPVSGLSATPFAAAAAGNRTVAPAMISPANVDYVNQTAVEVTIPNLGAAIATALGTTIAPGGVNPARYYIYQAELRDQAGNVTRDHRSVYVNNGSVPNIENLSNPSTFDGNATYEVGLVRDSVEVLEASLEIRYPNAGPGTLVWERPGSDLSSLLRMNADILDGVLFNDVIYRPQYDVAMPLGLAELGLPFIASLQTVDGSAVPDSGSIATSKPDSTRARIYNGFGADQEDYNHSTPPFTGTTGISSVISRSINSEELANANFNFEAHAAGAWTFTIVEGAAPGVVDCDAEYCVRAIGPLSTFTNPFNGGPVLVVWADDSGTGVGGEVQWRVLGVATPNFSHPFPTRDSGADRIYEWEFSTSGANPGTLTGNLALGAIGVRTGSNAALLTAAPTPDPFFNVIFDPTSDELANTDGTSVVFDLMEGANSTGEGIASVVCNWVDGSGNILVTAPDGLSLADVGDTCVVTVTDETATDLGASHLIRGTATGNDGNIASAMATVTVLPEEFEIDLTPAVFTEEIPNATDSPTIVEFGIDVLSGDAVSAFSCSVSAAAGVSVTEGTAPNRCIVSITDDAVDGNVTVTANATETGTGATDSDSAVLTLEGLTITFSPVSTEAAPTVIDWIDATPIDVVVGGSRDNTDIDSIVCVASEGWLDANTVGDGCEIEINDVTLAVPGDYEVEYTIVFLVDGRTEVRTAFITVPEQPEFAPEFDIATGPAADQRREIERDRTANFVVIDGEGLGIDLGASNPVVVSPEGTGVTATVTDDGAGTNLLEVVVDGAAQTGNYTLTVTFVEIGTGTEYEVLVYIRVIDTGTVEVPGQ